VTQPEVGYFIPPVHPAEKAAALQENLRRGWTTVPGTMDHDMGYPMRAEGPHRPLYVPPGPVIRPSRASGWLPFWLVLAATPAGAAILGLVARG
jgi:hypothetical protein